MGKSGEIDIRKSGKAGLITLTRPDALNALSYEMCMAIGEALEAWRDDKSVELVIIDAEGSRSFCAGGDIADLYKTGLAGDYDYARKFWADEYRINAAIKNFPKPYLAIMNGIVMGGGVGISAHGSHRIVTENTMFAMPETGIGLVPDVGGNWLLSRAKGHIGEYLAMTGARLGASDCIYAGIADFYVEEKHIGELVKCLSETGDLERIDDFTSDAPEGVLSGQQSRINDHFSKPTAVDIVASLEEQEGEWAQRAAKLLRRNCPLSVACATDLVRASRAAKTIEEVLTLEYRFTWRSMERGDFIEGIRAQIIDKDRNPKWNPTTLEEVDKQRIIEMLSPLDNNELSFVS